MGKQRQLNIRAMESNTRALEMDMGHDDMIAHSPRPDVRPQHAIPGFEFGHAKRFDFDDEASTNVVTEDKVESQIQVQQVKQSKAKKQLKGKKQPKAKKRPKAKASAETSTSSTRKNASDKLVQMQGAPPADNS